MLVESKKILITGARGYIAQKLIKALQQQYDITSICRTDFDLTDYAATCAFLKDRYFDYVIHTAAVGGSRLEQDQDTVLKGNLDMYYNLINNKDSFGRFISFGSGAELQWPSTPYGYSKRIIAESMLERDYCLNLRVFAVFDEDELNTRFIKSNVVRYINRQNLVIHENKCMDFFYMPDLITTIDYHLNQDKWLYSVIDCSYTKSYTLHEIAQLINNLDEHKVSITVGKEEGKPYTGQYTHIPVSLIGLEQGIEQVYHKLKRT